jgi:hypothetical protein
MNKGMKRILLILLFVMPLAAIAFHYLYLLPAITKAFDDQPDWFIKFITDTFYPRFLIEKKRFDLLFFLTKANQVVYRFILIYYLFFFISYYYTRKEFFRLRFNSFFRIETTSKNIDILRFLFFGYILFLSYELCSELLFMQPLKPFYKPILWLEIFNIPFPGYYAILAIGALWYTFTFLIILKIRTVLCSAISLFLFLLVQCWVFSFEKMDHSYATLTYSFILLPFLFDEQKKNDSIFNSWALQLIRISIAMVYFLSSLEKIFISGLSWLKPATLKTYMGFHETKLSKFIVQYDSLCTFISAATILFQLSFILIIFLPRFKWFWIIGGILFHTGTLLVMKIGHPLNPWIWVYIFFIDWTNVYDFFSARFKKFHLFSIR